MKEQEYLEEIQSLHTKLTRENAKEILEDVQKLEKIKPMRASCFALKADAMFMTDAWWEDVLAVLAGVFTCIYPYSGVEDILRLYQRLAVSFGDEPDVKRNGRMLQNLLSGEIANTEKKNQEELYYEFISKKISKDILEKCVESSYVSQDWMMYQIFGMILQQDYQIPDVTREWVNQIPNMGFLREFLSNEIISGAVLIKFHEDSSMEYQVLLKALKLLRKKVILLESPVTVEEEISMQEMMQISLDNIEEEENLRVFHPIEVVKNGKRIADNREELLCYVEEKDANREYGIFFSTLQDWKEINTLGKMHPERGFLYSGYERNDENELVYGWFGDYLTYISKIYNINCKEYVEKEASKKFSIIIPARNSSATLRYTLKTCLEQTNVGDYEIIVSDNSTGHNADVYELCKELNDPRIVYLKTPRDLPLPKSFEYAYLHANGEYIFALGSDDGLLPWALETLNHIITEYPDEEIIQWERGFYAWPGFNGGQQNQFTIPRAYKKGQYDVYYRDNIDYIAAVLNDPSSMYSLPMLYINSCFKRSYFKTLLEKTGRLWDGVCQDIYMGVITACIHSKILNLRYPLAIAGMSSGSVGASANTAKKTNAEFEKMMHETQKDNNVGGFCSSYYERFLPATGTDTSSLYGSLLRAVSIGVLPESYLTEVFDWKKMFSKLASELDIRDVAFDRKIHEMRYAAMMHGEEFLSWFDETIYHPMLEPKYVDDEKIKKSELEKTYKTGKTAQGGLVLDASEYGASNIYEAVKLFEKSIRIVENGKALGC